mmetsp:Transcript_35661/g.60708  ORF Transcript_35661/g.60708 Transcript_35661/m.60708 type:complete len:202 (-) Transcript_35661:1032-1637(-)
MRFTAKPRTHILGAIGRRADGTGVDFAQHQLEGTRVDGRGVAHIFDLKGVGHRASRRSTVAVTSRLEEKTIPEACGNFVHAPARDPSVQHILVISRVEVRVMKESELLLRFGAVTSWRVGIASLSSHGGMLCLLTQVIVLFGVRNTIRILVRSVICVAGQEAIVVMTSAGNVGTVDDVTEVYCIGYATGSWFVDRDGNVIE